MVGKDELSDRAGRLLAQAGQHVTVGVNRDGDVGVAEAFADDLGRDPGRQGGRRVAMADVMQANPSGPGGAACCSNHLENRPGPGYWSTGSSSTAPLA